MGLTLGEGTLYFGSGEKLDKFESIQVQKRVANDRNRVYRLTLNNNDTARLEIKTEISRNLYLSLLYGRRITNNYLRMHGGIMSRKPSRKKQRLL